MKFLIDLCLSPKTKEFLRSSNYEAIRVDEIKLERSTDREIFEYAAEND
jgi:predicted nuclease of predicted toxin-antitoxin system